MPASWPRACTWAWGILLVTFALYLTGVLQPGVPIEELPDYWTLSAHEYLEAVNHEFLHRPDVVVGWGWIGSPRAWGIT